MIANHIVGALRSLLANKAIALIQLVGLTIGYTCFVVGFGAAQYWSMSDHQYAGSDRTYALTQDITYKGTPRSGTAPSTAYHVAKYVRSEFPELESVARAVNWSSLSVMTANKTASMEIAGADPDFLRIFHLTGQRLATEALSRPRSVLLTADAAIRLFGSLDVVGSTLRLDNGFDLTVTGIFEPSYPSHVGKHGYLRFDLLVSWDVIDALIKVTEPAIADASNEIWFARCCYTYIQLPADRSLSIDSVRRRLKQLVERRVPASQRAFADIVVGAIPVDAIRAREVERLIFSNSGLDLSIKTAFLILASVVLIVACVNYANLAGAHMLRQSGQASIRRILGASRWTLAAQSIVECMLVVVPALCLALVLVVLATEPIKQFLAVDFVVVRRSTEFWMTLAAIVIVSMVAVGLYPASIAAFVRPQSALSTNRRRTAGGRLARVLVAAQFTIASILISIVIVIHMQHMELRRLTTASATSRVVAIANDLETAKVSFAALKAELVLHPQIEHVTAVGVRPWEFQVFHNPLSRSAGAQSAVVRSYGNMVWYEYFATMGIDVLAGRVFSPDYNDVSASMQTNPTTTNSVVIDRALSEQLGFTSPRTAVDQQLYVSNPFSSTPQSMRIIGVVENKSMHFTGSGMSSNSYGLYTASLRFPLIRIRSTDVASALAAIDEVWRKLAPQEPIRRQFTDELFERNYEIFSRISRMFVVLTSLALAIACLGLIGMAMHIINARTHETGVRKALGANTWSVLALLLRDFAKPVFVANLFALPLAYLGTRIYLSVFIHQMPTSVLPFMISLLVTLMLACLSTGFQAVRTARLTPAMVLRNE